MNMTVGDIFDKWSILRMKVRLLGEDSDEYARFSQEVTSLFKIEFLPDVADLIEANSKIWVLESDIRNGKDMPLEEVGRRALQIRDINGTRIVAKNTISAIFGDYQDTKVNHASERSNLEN
jgi:hypothetical protein